MSEISFLNSSVDISFFIVFTLLVVIIKNANSNIISVFYTKAKMRISITYEKFT